MIETIEQLKKKIELYEQNGIAKLYYSLNRKAAEMADLLNRIDLNSIALDEPKDKTFERMKIVWNDASNISNAISALGIAAGVTGDEEKDIKSKRRPESLFSFWI